MPSSFGGWGQTISSEGRPVGQEPQSLRQLPSCWELSVNSLLDCHTRMNGQLPERKAKEKSRAFYLSTAFIDIKLTRASFFGGWEKHHRRRLTLLSCFLWVSMACRRSMRLAMPCSKLSMVWCWGSWPLKLLRRLRRASRTSCKSLLWGQNHGAAGMATCSTTLLTHIPTAGLKRIAGGVSNRPPIFAGGGGNRRKTFSSIDASPLMAH